MNVTGIIAEYNPFHNGHKFHLEQARKQNDSDYVVVVMSGNYVQRGAPTIADKYARTEMVLKAGADLVLELPACFSTASAEYFAFGGVAILDKLGVVDRLCFGTESLDNDESEEADDRLTKMFRKIAELLLEEPEEYRRILQESQKNGLSNAAARSAAVGAILGQEYVTVMETSNNILGVEYLKSLIKLKSSIAPAPTARKLTSHNNTAIQDGFSSATAIRNAIFNRYDMNSLSSTVPQDALDILTDRYLVSFPIFRDDFSIILGGKLLKARTAAEIAEYFGVSSDLADRLFKMRGEFQNFTQFRDLVTAKNFTRATVGRALMHIVLEIRKEDMEGFYSPDSLTAVNVLGFRREAKPLLSEIKKKSRIRLVTKLSDYVPDDPGRPDMIMQTTGVDMLYRMVAMNKFDTVLKTPYEKSPIII